MSRTSLFIHVIFTTKHKKDFLTEDIKQKTIQHIKATAKRNAIKIKSINATSNHMHLLLQLHSTQNLAYSMHLLKGESSSWVNLNKLLKGHFAWQERYKAITVGVSEVRKVKNFINSQIQIHSTISLQQELKEILTGNYLNFTLN